MRTLDADGSGEVTLEEFRAREAKKLEEMKDLYEDMKASFEQYEVCKSLFLYLIFTGAAAALALLRSPHSRALSCRRAQASTSRSSSCS